MIPSARRTRLRRLLSLLGTTLILGGLLPVAAPATVLAAGSESLTGSTYSQDLDTLAISGTTNTVLPLGWDLVEAGGGARDNEQYAADTGGSNTGDTYSYGSTGLTERALGGLQSGTLIPTVGVSFTNASGAPIGSLDVAYTGEQWRLGTLARTDRLDFQISTDATSLATGAWTDVDPLDFVAPAQGPTLGALDGNASANRTAISSTIGGLTIADGATFWIRWVDFNASGADDGLAVDDFSLTPHSTDTPTDPSGVGAADPAVVSPGGSSLLIVTVTPGASPPSTGIGVAADLSSIGGSATQGFFDNATNGDMTSGDNVFSFAATVDAGTLPGAKSLPATIVDAQARSATTSIGLTVQAAASTVLISEVYGGGGNAGAIYTNDFVELYNPNAGPVSLAGWSIQYGSATGTTWSATALGGSIPAAGRYLVQLAAGAGAGAPLPTPDATGTTNMSATAGKVALVSTAAPLAGACPVNPAIADLAGYGATANCFEGSGAAPAPSNTTSIQRIGGGATDTNNNAADFVTGAPTPTGSADPAPTVVSTAPVDGAASVPTNQTVSVTFSEPVAIADGGLTINCTIQGAKPVTIDSGPTTFTVTTSPFAEGDSCTVTILAASVTDLDALDPPDNMAANFTFGFTVFKPVACGDPGVTLIHDIQGAGLASPLVGTPRTVEGVVIGDYQAAGSLGGFYIQEEDADADADPATSEGIFAFNIAAAVSPGDRVRVSGTVVEFNGLTELSPISSAQVCSSGNGGLVTSTSVTLPVAAIDDWERVEEGEDHKNRPDPDRRVDADHLGQPRADERADRDRPPHDEPHRRVHPSQEVRRRDRLAEADLVHVVDDAAQTREEERDGEEVQRQVLRGQWDEQP